MVFLFRGFCCNSRSFQEAVFRGRPPGSSTRASVTQDFGAMVTFTPSVQTLCSSV